MMKFNFLILFGLSLLISACGNGSGESNNANNQANASDSLLLALNGKITSDPNNYSNYLERAAYYTSKLDFSSALQDIDRAIAVDSTKGDIFLMKGDIHFKMKNDKQAYQEYMHCIALSPENTDCLLKKAALDIVNRQYSYAIENINNALKVNNALPYAYYLKGRLYKETGDTTLALSSYQTAVEVDPTYYDAYIEAGLLYHKQKNNIAADYYKSAIEVKPRYIEPWYNLGMYYQETGNAKNDHFNKAFACYDTILSIDPRFASAYFNKGFIMLEYQQKYDSSAVQFSKAIEILPGYFQAYYNRGLCYESMDNLKQAEADYRMALQIQPQYTAAAKALSRVLGE
jgi:tetratricopeptide (TPR) repeat protein